MNSRYVSFVAKELGIQKWQVENCAELLESGATVPFISRYRKEATGTLDEVQVSQVKHFYLLFNDLDKRKAYVTDTVESQGKMTPEFSDAVEKCIDPQELEDLFMPYKPKRRTRASEAKENGLEPLADMILKMNPFDVVRCAAGFVSDKVPTVEDALQGARDIIAERVSETPEVRRRLRNLYLSRGIVRSSLARGVGEEKGSHYRNWFKFSQSVSNIPSYRLLAILRGSEEGILSVAIDVDERTALHCTADGFYKDANRPVQDIRHQITLSIEDSYKRLLHPSIQNECLSAAKEKADMESVRVFGENLRQLLLQPPLGQKRVMGIDPGFRTGCKVVCLDNQGNLLHHDVIYLSEKISAMTKISSMVSEYGIDAIAVGNGTAGRETEAFLKRIALPEGLKIFSVSEDGASIYSASEVAREEFPDEDLTVRGAVSIGRRLMDPLAELVKIDPKSIGIGQYQHDVDQKLLKETLDQTVESCVDNVGVNLNTASKHLLAYVSGIGPTLAKNIVEYRASHGPFVTRADLMKVPRLGAKSYEQCAGFMRIAGAENPLDNSAVHPERYGLVRKMASDVGLSIKDLVGSEEGRRRIDINMYVSKEVGLPTLEDIMQELAKPGRDPRENAKTFEFSSEISTIDDVKPGMILPGIVTNITAFGAFVDIGVHQDGLVHISQLGDHYCSDPSKVVKLRQTVTVKVLDVDFDRQRISLTMKGVRQQ
ncbi:MAG: RNA-binding transcriptional accessory protein [Bacteroidales bacterium]|jgi:uncharacterized protein|nr:RNA-binding transcriptional accessory protein [Bacteroidales bacterium]MCI2146007.1 RNA-binding transcriptional accessory protein [Bacteroidales bacterium]